MSPLMVELTELNFRDGLLAMVKTDSAIAGIGDVCILESLHSKMVSRIKDEL